MIIALPLFGTRVSPRFDCAPTMLLATVEGGELTHRELIPMEQSSSLARANWLCQRRADVVICGGISGFSLRLLKDRGLQIFPWVSGDIDDAIRLFLEGKLQSGLIIGPGGRGRRCRRRGWGRSPGGRMGRFP